MDGKLLALARERLAEHRERHIQENKQRRSEIYARCRAVEEMDLRLRQIMVEVFGVATGRPGDLKALETESLDIQMRRAETLVSLGYPAEYLDEAFYCRECRDTGYVMGKMCACLRTLYEQEVAKSLSSLIKVGDERFETFQLGYYDDTINPRMGVSPRRCMETVYLTCRAYAERFAPGSINLLFRGGPGLGKTFLSACIARVVSEKGFSVVYESAGDAFEAFEEKKFSRLEDSDAQARVARMRSCALLILDDLGTEMPGAFAAGALYALLNTRIGENRSTIISTNLSAEELRRRYSPQIASRIEGEFHTLEFCGRDIRAIKKEQGL